MFHRRPIHHNTGADLTGRFANRSNHMGRHAESLVPEHYYIWATDGPKKFAWGPYGSYEQANRMALSKLRCQYEVVPLRTSDLNAATRILRSKELGESGDIETTFKRYSHKDGQE